uniref:Regulator of G protein signaling 20 n=1 Tax=Canis lupus familiaris TaxID=9615 RepID=A0A8I3Q6T7_CANLF
THAHGRPRRAGPSFPSGSPSGRRIREYRDPRPLPPLGLARRPRAGRGRRPGGARPQGRTGSCRRSRGGGSWCGSVASRPLQPRRSVGASRGCPGSQCAWVSRGASSRRHQLCRVHRDVRTTQPRRPGLQPWKPPEVGLGNSGRWERRHPPRAAQPERRRGGRRHSLDPGASVRKAPPGRWRRGAGLTRCPHSGSRNPPGAPRREVRAPRLLLLNKPRRLSLRPMGSERPEMRKRQMPAAQETAGSTPGQPGAGERGANACCFCWCCCCSCSCLTVRNQEQRPRRPSHELREEDLPSCEESPSPTLEEVNAWSQSFDKVMLTPAGRNAFREFLRTEFSEENMLFWMACEELKKEANKTIIEEKARTIYEDYISILSPKEVSLDSRVREVINRNMVEPSQHIFDDAQLQIYTLMHRDSYPRFMNSALYKDLLQSLSEKSAEA